VVLAARWPLYRDAPPFYDVNSPRVAVDTARRPGVRPDLSAALTATLDAIARRRPDLRVLVIGPVPELTLAPPECLAQRASWGVVRTSAPGSGRPAPGPRHAGRGRDRAAVEDRPGVARSSRPRPCAGTTVAPA
jgi:hypothetical protein